MRKPGRKIKYDLKNSPETVLAAAVEALTYLQKNSCGLDDYLDNIKGDALLRKRLSSLLFACFRYGKCADAAIKQCCNKPPQAEVKNLLLAALVMAKYQDSLPPESVANIAVTWAKKRFNNFTARFVNAADHFKAIIHSFQLIFPKFAHTTFPLNPA